MTARERKQDGIMPELLVYIGLPGSGKSTLAFTWLQEDPDGRIVVNRDAMRKQFFGDGWIWNRKDEDKVKAHQRAVVSRALTAGLSVLIDDTNLSSHVRESWRQLTLQHGASYVEQELNTPVDECIRRDRLRGDARVGQAVIDQMALRYGFLDWTFDPHGMLRNIAIVDIDGTVANDSHRLHHLTEPNEHKADCPFCPSKRLDVPCATCGRRPTWKNWPAYFAEMGQDTVISGTKRLLEGLAFDHLLVFISGRPISNSTTKTGIITEDWLVQHDIVFDRLFLRQDTDHRPSPEFKKEILDFMPKDKVAFIFDDDERCVEMYKAELPHATILKVL